MNYRFGPFSLDDIRRQLTLDGELVVVAPRLFDALLFFVVNAGELLDKEALLDALWPGIVVEENSLSQTVSALRRLLGDSARDSRYLQTVPRRGFRFIAAVEREDEASQAEGAEAQERLPEGSTSGKADESSGRAGASPTEFAAQPPEAQFTVDKRRRALTLTLAGGVVLAGAGSYWKQHRRSQLPAQSTVTTLAVLPFRPLVTTARDELLEIGMADSLVARLSNLPGVAVRSMGSARRFAGPDQDPLAAARALDVQWIVDGSIQRRGDQVRVTARLLDTSAGVAAWSGTFDERFTNVFDLQDVISTRVAAVLAPRLRSDEKKRLAGVGGTHNLDAYQLYLAARQQSQGIRTSGLLHSIELYGRAIAIDPFYALAYAGRAEAHRRTIFGSDGEPKVVFAAIERDAQRAIGIEPALAEAHTALGWHRFWHLWDGPGAEAKFNEAIALNTNDADAYFGYGQLLDSVDRPAEALARMRTARELDPLSPIQLTLDAAAVYWGQDHAEGRRRIARVFDIDPDFWVAYLTRGGMSLAEGRVADAIADMERADRLADGSSQAAMALGFALATNGNAGRARLIATNLIDASKRRFVPPTAYGLIFAGLGDTAAALDALERALEVRDVRLTLTRADSRWLRTVGNEPRFKAVVRRVGLGIQK